MQVSAELRWFWAGDCPDEVTRWFAGPAWSSDPVSEQRSDAYFLLPGQTEIGCKIRGAAAVGEHRTEMKALITRFERNRIELWGKWDWHVPASAPQLTVHKQRESRPCSTFGSSDANPMADDKACRIELTQVRVDGFGGHWWTLGLEAWSDLASAPLLLARGLDLLNPPVESGRLCNYPQFLDGLLASRAS